MSADLKDFRGKITPETDAALEAINRATGRDKSEIAREILHKWATDQIHVATILDRLMRAEGMPGIGGESGGGVRELRGRSGKRAA